MATGYFTQEDLEDRLGGPDFSATSTPTNTNIDDMVVLLSAMWDGLHHQAADAEGTGAATPEYVRHACISAAVYQVGQLRKGEPIDPGVQIKIMKEFMGDPSVSEHLSYTQTYPQISGKW